MINKRLLIIGITCILFVIFCTWKIVWAGEKEELEYQVAYWQEHIKVLQLDFELSQAKLKEAIVKK